MAEKVDNKNSDYNRDLVRSDRSNVDRGSRLIPRDPNKPSFQKVLEDTGQSPGEDAMNFTPQGQGSTTETKEAVRAASSEQERFYNPDKDGFQKKLLEKERPRDRDEPAKSGESKDAGAPRAKEAEKRVVGHGSLSERGHGEGEGGHAGGEGSGKGQGQRGQREFVNFSGMGLKGAAVKGDAKGIIHGSFEMELHAAQSLARATLPAPPTKPLAANKALMDQIVQYCRVVTKTDGDKEIDMQLHEAVFKGLKLKVSIDKDGKVVATFITESQEVSNLFNAQKDELKKALAEKGVAVESINVIII